MTSDIKILHPGCPTSLDELRALLVGRYVETERPARPNAPEEWGPTFGGAGVVVNVWVEGDEAWIEVDWGYGWALDPTTVVRFLDEEK